MPVDDEVRVRRVSEHAGRGADDTAIRCAACRWDRRNTGFRGRRRSKEKTIRSLVMAMKHGLPFEVAVKKLK